MKMKREEMFFTQHLLKVNDPSTKLAEFNHFCFVNRELNNREDVFKNPIMSFQVTLMVLRPFLFIISFLHFLSIFLKENETMVIELCGKKTSAEINVESALRKVNEKV